MSVTTSVKKRTGSVVSDSPVVPPLITLIGIIILFSLVVPHFGTIRNVSGIISAASINAIVVVGVTLLMIAGEFDLSVGSMVAMGGFLFAINTMNGGSPILAIALALAITAVMGAINGVLTIGTGIPSFIVTLGTRSIYRAAVWVFSGGLMLQTTAKLPVYEALNGRLDFAGDLFKGVNLRTSVLWALALGLLIQLVLTRSRFGNQIFATGGHPAAALAQGINVKRVKLISFTLTGVLAGLAGVLTFSQFQTVFVATGSGLELTAIASAVVGGTLLTGGMGSVVGGLVGILLINILRSGVVLLGLPSDNFEAIVGVTIIAASILNERMRGRL